MSVLDKFLQKKKVNGFEDLNVEERETYKKWEEILSGRKLTDKDVEEFLEAELRDTIRKIPEQHLGSSDDIFLKVKLDMILKVQGFLAGPRNEAKAMEAMLESQVDSML